MTDAPAPTRRAIVPAPARPLALGVIAVASVGFVVMALWLHGGLDPVGIDRSVDTWMREHTGSTVAAVLLAMSEPALTLGTAFAVALGAVLVRRFDVAVVAAFAPPATVFLGSVVLKPIIGRKFGFAQEYYGLAPGWAFPSGHQATLTTSVCVLVLLVLRSSWPLRTRVPLLVVATVWVVLGALGLVRNRYHYLTDTLGAILLALVVVPAVALAVDAVWPRLTARRLSSPAGRGRTRTPPAA